MYLRGLYYICEFFDRKNSFYASCGDMKNSFTRFNVVREGFAPGLLAIIQCSLVRKLSLLTVVTLLTLELMIIANTVLYLFFVGCCDQVLLSRQKMTAVLRLPFLH